MKKIAFIILILFVTANCFAAIRMDDEGVNQGYINALDFVGSNVSVARSGIVGTVTLVGGQGGGD